MYIIF